MCLLVVISGPQCLDSFLFLFDLVGGPIMAIEAKFLLLKIMDLVKSELDLIRQYR